jgi:histone-lysine N-methyltransferase SETMAR
MITIVFLEIGTKIAEECARKGLKNMILKMESTSCHNSRQKTVEIEKLGLLKIPHPPYSPDISPCDFWLFRFLKQNAKGIEHGSSTEVLKAVWTILAEIQRSDLVAAYEDAIEKLKGVIEIGREYLTR